MRKSFLTVLTAFSLSAVNLAYASDQDVSELPVSFENVFSQAMDDPNVMFYHGDKSYRSGDFSTSLRWMLRASEYAHQSAIKNSKFMIEHNKGTLDNREGVVDFLRYYAEPRGDQPADLFARMYLADYYRGDTCVWFSPDEKASCATKDHEPMAGFDLRQSYYYYEGASQQGDARSTYTSAMMNILGLGVPRNVPMGLEKLRKLSSEGSVSASHIMSEIYQRGYWVPQDRNAASKWLGKPVQVGIPSALITFAKNLEAGFAEGEELSRMTLAVNTYERLLSGVLANDSHRAEALYRLAMIKNTYEPLLSAQAVTEHMLKAVSIGEKTANEFSVKALIWMGTNAESASLKRAVKHYERAISMLEGLPLNIQQRHAVAWQKVAYAYASGQEVDFPRDERKFSEYMNRHHTILAKTFIPDIDLTEFSGYSAFRFPG
jgi:TPR repeat protein